MKTTLTVDQLKALRARWRENNNGFGDFANMVEAEGMGQNR